MSIAQSGEVDELRALDDSEHAARAIGTAIDGGPAGGKPLAKMIRYLPLALLTTASIVVLPVLLVAAFVPRGGVLSMAVSAVAGIAISLAIASAEASIWARLPHSRDLLFADLTLWGWMRRYWAERNLAATRRLYGSGDHASEQVNVELLARLSKLLQARDPYTHGHGQRVAHHAARIAKAMYLSPAEIAKIHTAAMVHDVGKLYTPRRILHNPGRLGEEEFAVLKRHASDGADMLAAVGDLELAAMVRHHHERIDGHGYPDGLTGLSIPLGARIIAVADTFDAITSNRAYRPAGTHRQALETLSRESGSQLDAAAVTAFLSCYSARRPVAWLSFLTVVPQRIVAGLLPASASIGAGAASLTSIMPAMGAAGLLALSSGWHQQKPASAGGAPQTTFVRTAQRATPSTATPNTATPTTDVTSPPRRRHRPSTKQVGKHHVKRLVHASPGANAPGGGTVEGQGQAAPSTTIISETTTTIHSSDRGPSAPSAPSSLPTGKGNQQGSPEDEASTPAAAPSHSHGSVAGVIGTFHETLSKTTETVVGAVGETLSQGGNSQGGNSQGGDSQGNGSQGNGSQGSGILPATTEALAHTVNETLSKTGETLSKTTSSLGETLSNLP